MDAPNWNGFRPLLNVNDHIGASFVDSSYTNYTVDTSVGLDTGRHNVTTKVENGQRFTVKVDDGVAPTSVRTIDSRGTGRTDLLEIARSANPYSVTWDSQPNATFTLTPI